MDLSIIVAASTNNVIGRGGELPWRLPEDLKRFKALTTGKPVLMGRLTHESIGRPLPGRRNIVLSSDLTYTSPGCEAVATVENALRLTAGADETMIIGGSRVYRELLPKSGRIYMTRVHAQIEGDAFFPEIDAAEWRVISREDRPVERRSGLAYSFELLVRV